MLWWFALPFLLFAPFAVFVSLQDRLSQYLIEIKRLQRQFRITTLREDLDMKFGPSSFLGGDRRFEIATQYFAKLEDEILNSDYSHVVEVLASKDLIILALKNFFGSSTQQFAEWHSRLLKVIEAVNRHEERKEDSLFTE